jgi:DNA-binding NarL/FixJ family response regulator
VYRSRKPWPPEPTPTLALEDSINRHNWALIHGLQALGAETLALPETRHLQTLIEKIEALSAQRLDIQQLVAGDLSSRKGTEQLNLAPTNVPDHAQTMLKHFQVNNRGAASAAGACMGLARKRDRT